MAINKLAGQAHINFTRDNVDLNLMTGYSSAEVQRAYANNNVAAITHDSLNNFATHFWGNYKNLKMSAYYTQGSNSILGSGQVLSVDYNALSANAEYDFIVSDALTIKPGASFKTTNYNSMGLGSTTQRISPTEPLSFFESGYEIVEDEGDLNNSVISGYLQADYHKNKFRLIGAARVDKFKYPNKAIVSPLLAATYKVTDDFLVRGSYGRSSRTPFMFDLFVDINLRYPTNTIYNGHLLYNNIWYRGTEKTDEITNAESSDYKLLTVDNAEIGFRHKISETFTLDIELFWSQLSNLITLAPVARDTLPNVTDAFGNTNSEAYEYHSYLNLNTKPQQTGASLSLTSVPFKNMSFQIFVTIQQTIIKDYPDAVDAKGNEIDTDGDGKTNYDFQHMATPAFTGGLNMNYKAAKNLNINLNSYFYSHQTLTIHGFNTAEVEPNILLNLTINYEVAKGVKLFATGRNLVGGMKRQFAFTDKIGPSVLGGINLNF